MTRIKFTELEKNLDMNRIKLNFHGSHYDWTIVIFEWFIMNHFSSNPWTFLTKWTDRPSVDQFSKKGCLIKLDSKPNFVTFQSVEAPRCKNPKNAIIGHLNLNSLRNKFVAIDELIKNKIDICWYQKLKLTNHFQTNNLR